MGWLIAGGLLSGLLVVAMLTPVRLALALRQDGWQANLDVEVRYSLLRFTKAINVTANVNMALEHMWKRWRAKGVPVKPDLQETIKKAPQRKLMRAALPGLRRLGRATLCHKLQIRVEVGAGDAMESALLAGALWGGTSMLVGLVSRWVQVPGNVIAVAVVPNFRQSIWRAEVHCILGIRLGKAIMAIVWLLRQEASRSEVIAWVRDSLRRKGDQSGDRTPNSRPHEDGHGKP